jgi:hypothetical protein
MVNFKDRERVGIGRDLYTEIEGGGRMAQIQERLRRLDPESRIIRQLEAYYFELSSLYGGFIGGNLLSWIIDLFQNSPNKMFKNTNTFILGCIYYQERQQKTQNSSIVSIIQNLIVSTNQSSITLSDVIRYLRLIEAIIEKRM